jgi:hypothetical protein
MHNTVPLTAREIRRASDQDLRQRLRVLPTLSLSSWAVTEAVAREERDIRRELLTRQRERDASAGIEAELARIAQGSRSALA